MMIEPTDVQECRINTSSVDSAVKSTRNMYRDYFMVGECVRFLFTSCERSLNERVSAANV